jgi:hypothetical protein
MSDLAASFNDPLDPARSLQLNNNYWKGDRFEHLDMLREADDDINHRRFKSLRKTLKPVKTLIPPELHRSFLRRLVYSMVYSVSFAPIRLSIKLSGALVRANSYNGSANETQTVARETEELKYIVDLIHSIYRGHYGADVLSSTFAVRYINSQNPVVSKVTAYGEFSDFHLDEGKDFTCILYLSEVGPQNGCFSYIDGSPAVPKSHLLRALHQVVDFDLRLSNPEQVASLPLELRGGMGIGNYLDDEKKGRVRTAKVDLLGGPGDGIIFNGFDTIHRGGKPLSGSRTALFVSTRGHVNMRLRKALFDQFAYVWF